MRIVPFLTALALCLPVAADVKLKARTTVAGETFDSSILVRGSRQRVERANDPIVTLYQCDQHRMVLLNPNTKAYRVIALDAPADASAPVRPLRPPRTGASPTVTFTTTFAAGGADKKMRGLLAHRFTSKTEAEASPDSCSQAANAKLTTNGWYADLPGSDLSCADSARASLRLRRLDPACSERTIYRVEGNPPAGLALELETTMTTSSGPVTTRQETLELQQTSLTADLFNIPADYRLVRTDEELLSGPSQTPAPADPASTSLSRPSRSTRTGEPRPALPRICILPVSDSGSEKGHDWTRLEIGRGLNAAGFESVPLPAATETGSADAVKAQNCAYILTAELTGGKGKAEVAVEADKKADPGAVHPGLSQKQGAKPAGEKNVGDRPAGKDSAEKHPAEKHPGAPPDHESAGVAENKTLVGKFTLQAADSTTIFWSQTLEAQPDESRDAFLDRAAKTITAEIQKRNPK